MGKSGKLGTNVANLTMQILTQIGSEVTITDYDLLLGDLNLIVKPNVYVKYINVTLGRIGKSGKLGTNVANLTAEILAQIGNEVTVEQTFFEKEENNRYHRTFQLNYSICDVLEHDRIFTPVVRKFGNLPQKCPIYPMTIKYENFSLSSDTDAPFPPAKENSEWKLMSKFRYTRLNKCSVAEGIPADNPHLVLLFFIAQLLLRELAKCHRLVQLVPMDMSGYYDNRAGPSNLGNVISQILLCKQITPDFNQEELCSIAKDSQDILRILHDMQEFLPPQESFLERNIALAGDEPNGQWGSKTRRGSLYKNMGMLCCMSRPNYL